jgi:hypothetical protein
MSAKTDFRRAARLAESAATSARKTGELALASGEVIARRTLMGAQAFGRPTAADMGEAVQMVSEKGLALARSGVAASRALSDLSTRSAALALDEAAIMGRAVEAASRCTTPMELAMVQSRFAYDAFGRMMSQGLGWATLASAAGAAAMAPFHTAATANARRLRR